MALPRRFRFSFWLLKESLTRYFRLVFLGLIGAGLIGFIIYYTFPRFIKGQTSPRMIGMVGSFTESDFPLEIQELISTGLTKLTPNGEATPSLAASWEVQDSGKTYIFKLKEGLEWQDGAIFNAKHVNYNLVDVEADSPTQYTIKYKLKDPYSPFPTVLAQPLFRGVGGKKPLGLGDYKVQTFTTEGGFLSKLVLAPYKANGRSLYYKFYPNDRAAIMALKLGEVDEIHGLADVESLKGWNNVKVSEKVNYQRITAVYFNTTSGNLANKSIRQALTYAIPDQIFSGQELADGPISKVSWAYTGGLKQYNYDMDHAKKLIARSGQDVLQEKSSKKEPVATSPADLKITLTTIPAYEHYAQEIKKSWDALGVVTEVSVETKPTADFQALLAVMILPPDPDQYPLWHSTQKTNITGYSKPKVDKALEDGRKLFDKEERKKIYAEFQKNLIDDAPAAFLFYPKEYFVSRVDK